MKTDIGEYIVGAYLKIIKDCDFIDYNVRDTHGGLVGLNEIDVVGFNFNTKTVYLCEVTTHLRGVLYGTYPKTIRKLKTKLEKQHEYAEKYFSEYPNKIYMFWSPRVPVGKLTEEFERIEGLNLMINEEYTEAINKLRNKAKKTTNDFGNPFFRTLQILEHLKQT